jgi:hypothetical protein
MILLSGGLMHDVDEDALAREWVKRAVRTEMVKRGLTYADLSERLSQSFDLVENERVLRNKIARGTFSAAFFAQCLTAMGCKTLAIDLPELRKEWDEAIDEHLGLGSKKQD